MTMPPSTFFTEPPHWHWLIICYFFLGGIAGGSYFIATLMNFLGGPLDRPLARLGYYVAFPAVVVSALLLTADLGRPERFWHMLVQSDTARLMWKPWSPMSIGSWALLVFGAFAFLSFVGAIAEPRGGALAALARGPLGMVISGLGALVGFFVAGYTGVLLTVTNRPLWADTTLLGLVFVVSAASISAALLSLLGDRTARGALALHALERFDSSVLVIEFLTLVALVVSLGGVARAWFDVWGVLFVIVLVGGILVPIALQWRSIARARLGFGSTLAAVLVVLGGFLLRIVIVLSSEGV